MIIHHEPDPSKDKAMDLALVGDKESIDQALLGNKEFMDQALLGNKKVHEPGPCRG